MHSDGVECNEVAICRPAGVYPLYHSIVNLSLNTCSITPLSHFKNNLHLPLLHHSPLRHHLQILLRLLLIRLFFHDRLLGSLP